MKVYLLEVFDENYLGVFTSFEKCLEAVKFLNERSLAKGGEGVGTDMVRVLSVEIDNNIGYTKWLDREFDEFVMNNW